jgi:hypothetical protein
MHKPALILGDRAVKKKYQDPSVVVHKLAKACMSAIEHAKAGDD